MLSEPERRLKSFSENRPDSFHGVLVPTVPGNQEPDRELFLPVVVRVERFVKAWVQRASSVAKINGSNAPLGPRMARSTTSDWVVGCGLISTSRAPV